MSEIRKPNGKLCMNCSTALVGKQRKWCKKACHVRHKEKQRGLQPPTFLKTNTPKRSEQRVQQLIAQPSRAVFRAPNQELSHWEYVLSYWQKVNLDARNGVYSMATLSGAGIGAMTGSDDGGKFINTIIGGLIGKAIDNWRQKDTITHSIKMIEQAKLKIQRLKQMQSLIESTNKLVMQENLVKVNAQSNEISIERTKTYSAINATELTKIKRTHYQLDGQWKYFLGKEIEQGFSALIHGTPKAGKSHFSVQFAEYLRTKHGNVAYFAAEEGTAKTFENKTERWSAGFPIVYNILGTDGIEDYIKNHKPKFVFIDSISRLSLGYEQLKFLVDEYPNISWFFIAQSTKANTYRGSKEIEHLVDTIINVDSGIAYQKGRTTEGAKTEFKIFPV